MIEDEAKRLEVTYSDGVARVKGHDKHGNVILAVEGTTLKEALKKVEKEAFEKYRALKKSDKPLADEYMRLHVEALVTMGRTWRE